MSEVAAALARLDEITRRLRVECPWDREQDERSIVPHTVEEAYELADAAAQSDDEKMLDELGDVLFQVYFLALLLEEREAGSLAAVAEGMTAKLIRRHPHVFEESEARELLADSEAEGEARRRGSGVVEPALSNPGTGREVLVNWDRIKREVEGRGGEGELGEVPENLPGLLYARKVLRRLDPEGGAEPPKGTERERAERFVGQTLLELVRISRRLGVDPELSLRAAAKRLATGG